jgi:hypothetical protein
MLGLADLARPELKLAGNRFNPDTDAPSRQVGYRALALLHRPSGAITDVAGIPAGAAISNVRWAPDGSAFAFAVLSPDRPGVALYLARPSPTATATQLLPPGTRLSSAFVDPFDWCPGSRALILNAVPPARGPPPAAPPVPSAPLAQECAAGGRPKPARTYQDLLVTDHDEAVFEHHATTQLLLLRLPDDPSRPLDAAALPPPVPLGPPAMVIAYDVSPDGSLLLFQVLFRAWAGPAPRFGPFSMLCRE